jgi:hypothetical protein
MATDSNRNDPVWDNRARQPAFPDLLGDFFGFFGALSTSRLFWGPRQKNITQHLSFLSSISSFPSSAWGRSFPKLRFEDDLHRVAQTETTLGARTISTRAGTTDRKADDFFWVDPKKRQNGSRK